MQTARALLLALLVCPPAQDEAPPVQRAYPERGVTFALRGVERLAGSFDEAGSERAGLWTGRLGSSELVIDLWFFPRAGFGLDRPDQVVELVELNEAQRDREEGERLGSPRPPFRYQECRPLPGHYGRVPYAYLGVHTRLAEGRPVAQDLCLAGILEREAWSLHVRAQPALTDAERAALVQVLAQALVYDGPEENPAWTEEEALARWTSDAPPEVHADLLPHRTDHYLILSNCGKGSMKSFGAKMEECYTAIRAVYPFEAFGGERLLPVFLFRTDQQYYDFCVKNLAWTEAQARLSKGVAWKDFYATWYEAPRDPVHVHEATHQLFANRLHLSGGGSWFQEGVAEYMSTTRNDRKLFRNAAEDRKHVPLRDFVVIESLLQSQPEERVDGSSAASDGYLQAACVIEFVRESPWSKDRFQGFLQAVGRAERGSTPAIEAALREVLDVDLAGFEQRFLEYWHKRR